MALARHNSHHAYADLLGRITHEDAAGEPDYDQLFTEPSSSPYPKISISAQVEIDGLSLTITINDTPIAEAVQLLKRRGAVAPVAPAAPIARPAKRRRRTHPTQPTFDLVWSDFDDAPASETGARVIQLAHALRDDNPYWSDRLAAAAQTCKENLR